MNEPINANFWGKYDPEHKEACELIDQAVKKVGWKSFVYHVLNYQLRNIKSNYRLLKSWK